MGGEQSPVELEVKRCIEAIELEVMVAFGREAIYLQQVEVFEADGMGVVAPESGGAGSVGIGNRTKL